jgi:hypothetical protein
MLMLSYCPYGSHVVRERSITDYGKLTRFEYDLVSPLVSERRQKGPFVPGNNTCLNRHAMRTHDFCAQRAQQAPARLLP